MRAAYLWAGPRGRRLCLEAAAAVDPDIRALVFELGYEMDPERGRGRVLLQIMSGDDAGCEHDEDETVTSATVADLARRLAEVDLHVLTLGAIEDALVVSVDDAMYWQAPHGEDVLAAHPDLRPALVRIASAVARLAPAHWSAARGAEQWAVDWRDENHPFVVPADPRAALAGWHRAAVREEERAAAERPDGVQANWSGTWWSTPDRVLTTTGSLSGGQPVGLRAVEDSLGWEHATAVPIRGAGRTYEIRGDADWAELCRRFPLEVTASRRHDWFRVTGRDGRWLIPDWSRVAGEWDAVHVTVGGYLAAATRLIKVDDEYATMIAGWGPDVTVWLGDVAREGEGGRVAWRCDPRSDVWTRTAGNPT